MFFVTNQAKLCSIMNHSLASGELPNDWKTAIVKPIFKRGDKFDPLNYRPISLTSVIVKILESLIFDKLIDFLVTTNRIPEEQHRFVPGRSIVSNLLCCLEDWTNIIDANKAADIIYLDFSKAFDRVPRRRLLYKLKHNGINGSLLNWIESFLSNRTFKVCVNNSLSTSRQVMSGVPQGSVLGPLLFVLYTADIGYNLASTVMMYADDLKLYGCSNNNSVLSDVLSKIYEWSKIWLIPLNLSKCTVLHLGKNNPKFSYRINNVFLSNSDSCIDLGVTISSTLSWTEHINRIVKRANQVFYLISKSFVFADLS
ncbi:putative RNA-directed DNA polymerase from transposon X-element-like Protein [Tribolium castaneum]|uniref:Putative RNA-directed DNA polymerase from transposon X-element-like Protein n=1 Tax=Tribolium castaneum TaxID=7070 RepID=D7ELD0_TRICA|nr:putative RNA-directed DNA polymerase from transposon X-element-like Protein [Tribolium castaneum]